MDSKPSSLNILKKYYVKVLKMEEYIRESFSNNRYAKVLNTSRGHDGMTKLLQTAYVCFNPRLDIEDEDGLDYTSILSPGKNTTQAEACF